MKEKIKKIIKFVWGTQENILLKASGSLFITGILFFYFTLLFKENENIQLNNIYSLISGIIFGIWLSIISCAESLKKFGIEILRMLIFFLIIVFSLNFVLNTSVNYYGSYLIIHSLFSCLGIVFFFFYIISKFIDVLIYIKRLIKNLKEKLFNSIQPSTSKIKNLIENITAFWVAITAFTVAIKSILDSLLNFFR